MFTDDFKETQIGFLPKSWEVVTLGDLADYINGYAFKPQQWETVGRPIIRIQNLTGSSDTVNYFSGELDNRYFIESDDLLISWSASLDAYIWQGDEAWLNQHIFKVDNIVDKCDKRFLYFALKHIIERIRGKTRGSTMKHITRKEFVATPVMLPPLSEQQAIANVLSTVRQAIEATEGVIAATRELKRSMMKHLFTYGPVPVHEADQVSLKETEIGDIPQDWSTKPLGELAREPIKNGAFIKRDRFGNGVPFLNVSDTYNDISVDLSKLERVECTQSELDRYRLLPNDLIFVRSSLKREGVGQCCIVENLDESSIFDCHLMRVRIKEDEVIPKFLAYFYLSALGKNALIARSKTTTMTTINQSGLSSAISPLPSLSEQNKILNYLESVDEKIKTEIQRKAALEELLNSLLHHLMTGKVRVKL